MINNILSCNFCHTRSICFSNAAMKYYSNGRVNASRSRYIDEQSDCGEYQWQIIIVFSSQLALKSSHLAAIHDVIFRYVFTRRPRFSRRAFA